MCVGVKQPFFPFVKILKVQIPYETENEHIDSRQSFISAYLCHTCSLYKFSQQKLEKEHECRIKQTFDLPSILMQRITCMLTPITDITSSSRAIGQNIFLELSMIYVGDTALPM
jgi:hypothetical protein